MAHHSTLTDRFEAALSALPLIAILRGIKPDEAVEVGLRIADTGFRLIEIPLNSPDPFASIAAMRRALPDEVLVGAGTVLAVDQIEALAACGSDLAVMPHADPALIRTAKAAGLFCVPGIATPTEAFAALAAGADALKIFPAELVTPAILKAIRVVLPKQCRLLPVGGIAPDTMRPFVEAGAAGFGLGSALYKPGMTAEETAANARKFVAAFQSLRLAIH